MNIRGIMQSFSIIILLFPVQALFAGGSPAPKLPYYDWGACPFECCTYRQWTANADIIVRKDHIKRSPPLFKIRKGENVQGITGVVITRKAGKMKALKAITLDEKTPVSLKPSDIIYTLHYLGEGYELFWFNGKLHSDWLSDIGIGKRPLQNLSSPVTEWWVKVQNSKGEIGWTDQTRKFDHIDACE